MLLEPCKNSKDHALLQALGMNGELEKVVEISMAAVRAIHCHEKP